MYFSKLKLKRIYFLSLTITAYFLLSSCSPKSYKVTGIEGKQIPIDSTIVSDAKIDIFIAPYREHLDAEMNTVLAFAPVDLTKERSEPETLLGNFMADLCYDRANPVFNARTGKNIDFVLLNIGGLRANINAGDVTVRNAYEVMPFENSLLVVELTYDKIQELLQYYAEAGNAHPVSKQLHFVFKGKNIESAQLNGKDFDKDKNYYVLTNDYLANGGDSMNFFLNPVSSTVLDYKVRDALLDELKEIDTIQVKLDGRVERK